MNFYFRFGSSVSVGNKKTHFLKAGKEVFAFSFSFLLLLLLFYSLESGVFFLSKSGIVVGTWKKLDLHRISSGKVDMPFGLSVP